MKTQVINGENVELDGGNVTVINNGISLAESAQKAPVDNAINNAEVPKKETASDDVAATITPDIVVPAVDAPEVPQIPEPDVAAIPIPEITPGNDGATDNNVPTDNSVVADDSQQNDFEKTIIPTMESTNYKDPISYNSMTTSKLNEPSGPAIDYYPNSNPNPINLNNNSFTSYEPVSSYSTSYQDDLPSNVKNAIAALEDAIRSMGSLESENTELKEKVASLERQIFDLNDVINKLKAENLAIRNALTAAQNRILGMFGIDSPQSQFNSNTSANMANSYEQPLSNNIVHNGININGNGIRM